MDMIILVIWKKNANKKTQIYIMGKCKSFTFIFT
jgi:hypothetical protein